VHVVFLDVPVEQCLRSLLGKRDGHFIFFDRGFRKDIRRQVSEQFHITLPSDLLEATRVCESRLDLLFFVRLSIERILVDSQRRLLEFVSQPFVRGLVCSTDIFWRNCEVLPKKPKAIYFDLSNTIHESHAIDVESIDSVLTKYGLPTWLGGTRLKKDRRKSMRNNFGNYFGEENAAQAYDDYFQLLMDNMFRMPLLSHVRETLEYCRSMDIRLVLVTNRDGRFVSRFFEVFGMREFFAVVVTPETSGFTKPDPNMLSASFQELGLDPGSDCVLFVGDSFADILCAIRAKCVPIRFTAVVGDEISPRNHQRLLAINRENPVRHVPDLRALVDLLELSRRTQWCRRRVKITYIGAHGKIGRLAVSNLFLQVPDAEVVLIGSGNEDSLTRLRGFVSDCLGAVQAVGRTSDISFCISNDYVASRGSDLVICGAGKWPSRQMFEQYAARDPGRRLTQSLVNAGMVRDIAARLQEHCPDALLLVVTNQVDMICHVARAAAPRMEIIGLTGGVDSARARQVLSATSGLMAGFHNATMTPLVESFTTATGRLFPVLAGDVEFSDDELQADFRECEQQTIDQAMGVVREMGLEISVQQGAGLSQDVDTGSSVLPAAMIVRLAMAYCFGKERFVESFNTLIRDGEVAEHFGVEVGTALSIPMEVSRGAVRPCLNVRLSESEKRKMRDAQEALARDLELIDDATVKAHGQVDSGAHFLS
jgi:phosphoglycolate phosphatase-like HAD superfamily hydrolase/malate/lactate dehydrogenase